MATIGKLFPISLLVVVSL